MIKTLRKTSMINVYPHVTPSSAFTRGESDKETGRRKTLNGLRKKKLVGGQIITSLHDPIANRGYPAINNMKAFSVFATDCFIGRRYKKSVG